MIKPREFPCNSLVTYGGRLIDLMRLHRELIILSGPGTWGAWTNSKKQRRLVFIGEKVRKHITWLFNKKFPDCPKVYWEPFRGGYIFFNAAHHDKFNKMGKYK